MDIINKSLILQQFPLFNGLSEEELNLIKERSEILEYKKNQIVYQEHSEASALYCIVSGRVFIYTEDMRGNVTPLEYLHRGKYFGVISLLTNETHSVTARAINDCAILVIKKDDFNFILHNIPKLAIDLSQTLSRRLKSKAIHQKTIFESTIISVFSSYSQAGKTVYALNLALSLFKETHKSLIILDISPSDSGHSLPSKLDLEGNYKVFNASTTPVDIAAMTKDFVTKTRFGIDLACISYNSDDESSEKRLMGILSLLVNDYHYIVLDLPSSMDNFVLSVLNQSDLIHILTSPEPVDLKKTYHLIGRLKKDFHFLESKIKILINEYKLSKITYQQQKEILDYNIYATLPRISLEAADRMILDDPQAEYSKAIRRISRQVGDALVGLVLGVGAGYGFCHIGILKVLEEEKIPIDVIVGSSIGSFIASLWATGRSAAEILAITTEEFKQPKYTWSLVDLTFPSLGFIKGNKFYKFLKKYLGNKTFYDVRLPLKIIASDIKRKEPIVFDKGPLIDAVMASCSMPGVFQPFKLNESILLDGGLTNPLPTEVLFKMGVKKIIAVNVTPSREDILKQYEKIKEDIAATKQAIKKKKWFNLKEYLQERFKNNILDIIFTSIEVMQSDIILREGQLADIVLHPDTSGLHWVELYKSREFALRGEEEARKNIARIRQVINE